MSAPKSFPTKVRTTFQPDVPLEVGETEYNDLSRQGLILDDVKAAEARDLRAAASAPNTEG